MPPVDVAQANQPRIAGGHVIVLEVRSIVVLLVMKVSKNAY